MLIFPKLLLGFQDLPKNASTTTFAWLFECIYGYSFFDKAKAAEREPLHIHQFFWRGKCRDSQQLNNADFAQESPSDLFTFALTRDPVKRYLSMYSNRVQHFDELSSSSSAAPRLQEAGLQPSPDVNHLAEHLEQYLACDKNIYHHTRPMSDFLGEDLSIFSRLADVSELNSLIEQIKAHWKKHNLPQLVENAPQPQRLQTGGRKLGLEVLTPRAFERLLGYYAVDYERIPTIDRRKIEEDFAKARAEAGQTSTPTVTRDTPFTTRLLRQDEDCPIVELFWVDDLPTTIPADGNLTISGALLLQPTVERNDWELIAVDRQGEQQVPWHFKSPNMAKQFPARDEAASSRYRIRNLKLSRQEPVQLHLQSSQGERWHLLSIKAT